MKRTFHWNVVDGAAWVWVPEGAPCGHCQRMAFFFANRMGSTRCSACEEGR